MRFHMHLAFSEAQAAHAAALAVVRELDDAEVSPDDPKLKEASEAEYAALDKLMLETPAITPSEVAAKLALFHQRDMHLWENEGGRYRDAISADLARMQGWPISPDVLARWTAWRDIDERYEAAAARSDEEGEALLEERESIYAAFHNAPCVTPGDFIVKQYAHLHGTLGGTLHGAAKEDMTGNPHDIDIDGDQYDGRFEAIEQPACYHDIDATDIGANLLAYGLPYFDAERWMERADAIGLQVDLTQQQDGRWMFGQRMDLRDEELGNDPRIRREERRLRRLIANDHGGPDRVRAVADEIRREWPQLVRPFTAETPIVAEAAE